MKKNYYNINPVPRDERDIEEEGQGLKEHHRISNEANPAWCNGSLETYPLRLGNILILKGGDQMFLRPQRVLNLVVDKHLQLAEKWKAIHICNLGYQLDPAKVFWKIGSNKQEDFFGLYLGNLTTLRYSKDEDLVVFINREEERQKSKPSGDARPRKKKNISTLTAPPDKAAGIQPAGAGPGTNGGGGDSQI